MIAARIRSAPTMAMLAVVCLLVAGPTSAEILITEQEAGLPNLAGRGGSSGFPAVASTSNAGTTKSLMAGPKVLVVSPAPTAGAVKSPVALKIRFESRGGIDVDLDSLKVTLQKSPAVDLTQRVKEFVRPDGIDMPVAEVPPGSHTISIEITDINGRPGRTEFTLNIEDGRQAARAAMSGRRIFALVVGMDHYKRLPPLHGAVADARDIEQAVRRIGATEVTTLIDAAVTRAALTGAMTHLIDEAHSGDLIVISFAGHGSQEPARALTRENNGVDEVFMLSGFEPEGPGTAERVIDKEINNWLSRLDSKGASVIFVADTCHGGGLSKSVDPRIGGLTYRALRRVPSREEAAALPDSYYVANDQLPAAMELRNATGIDDLKGLTFIAAVDKNSKAPEIIIPTEPTPRGAVSYAFARALEGAADIDHDGRVTRRELIAYIREKTRDLTERGQEPVIEPLDRLDDVIFASASGLPESPPSTTRQPKKTSSLTPTQPQGRTDIVPETAAAVTAPLRLGVLNGAIPPAESLGRQGAPFVLMPPAEAGLDGVWDMASGDVVSSLGDIVARHVGSAQLAGVVDRLAAIRRLAVLPLQGSARLHLAPDKRTYHVDEKVNLRIDGIDGRYLIMANISGDGTIQFVYPMANDDPLVLASQSGAPKVIGDVVIKPPFGSEVLVAIASRRRLPSLEELLIRRNDQRGAREFVDLLSELHAGDAEVSFISFFTEP